MEVSVGSLVNRVWNGGPDVQAGVVIYYWEHPKFWLISSSQNDPLLGPQFHPPPCGHLAAPYLFAHREPGPNFKLYNQMRVLGLFSYPVSHWPCPGRAGHASE